MTAAADETSRYLPPPPPLAQDDAAAEQDSRPFLSHAPPRRTQSQPGRAQSMLSSLASLQDDLSSSAKWRTSRWRHTLGVILLLATVLLWTASNFLASTIFADNTYSKPYFLTYVNSSFFIIPLVPVLVRKWMTDPEEIRRVVAEIQEQKWRFFITPSQARRTAAEDEEEEEGLVPKPANQSALHQADQSEATHSTSHGARGRTSSRSTERRYSITRGLPQKLSIRDTSVLALPFCFLWFFANYFSVACLEYTTVGSATILTSTSSIWTLIFGTLVGVERFTLRKLLGVLASLAGVAIISSLDVTADDNSDRGTFPHKTAREHAIGDSLALVSALVYGIYCVVIKKRIGDESRINMPLFFGLVGLLNVTLMWPGFLVLHLTRVEPFQLPPSAWITAILAVNSTSSLVSDYCWAFAMLLTSPLLVTVGLSLTIPLSLVGQMLLSGTYASWAYWLGAAAVVGSFVFINHEEKKEGEQDEQGGRQRLAEEDDLDLLPPPSGVVVVPAASADERDTR